MRLRCRGLGKNVQGRDATHDQITERKDSLPQRRLVCSPPARFDLTNLPAR